MDPFELMFNGFQRPETVKSTVNERDFDFDEGLIDRVLGVPNKIEIPERYIPEREQLPPEEEEKRSQKAERICRLLSKSNCGPVPFVLPHPSKQSSNNVGYNSSIGSNNKPPRRSESAISNSGLSASETLFPGRREEYHSPQHQHHHHHYQQHQHQQGLPVTLRQTASANRRPLSSSLKKAASSSRLNRNNTRTTSNSNCDWSLAGVSAPTSPHPSSSLSRHSYYSSSNSATSLYVPTSTPTPPVASKSNHSYHSSYSSTSSGRSSSDREDLLHLQHNLAREVTEKSRLVAVRATLSSPSPSSFRYPSDGSRYREPSPPSPIDLPTIQQREGFFT